MKREGNSLVQIEHKDRHIEIRYFVKARDKRYLCWVIPTPEARDLAQWWNRGGMRLLPRDLPVTDCRAGFVAVSISSLKRVDVRGIDPRGRLSMLGHSLPSAAVALLTETLNCRDTSRPNIRKKGSRSCSRKSS